MTPTIALIRAEKALLSATDIDDLERKWSAYCVPFPHGSDEHKHLLGIYHDIAARFAVEAFKYVRAG